MLLDSDVRVVRETRPGKSIPRDVTVRDRLSQGFSARSQRRGGGKTIVTGDRVRDLHNVSTLK